MAYQLNVQTRPDGNPRQLRRQGLVPGVVYGPKVHQHIALSTKDLEELLRRATRSARVMLRLDGQELPAFIKELQYDLLTDRVIHVDFFVPAHERAVTIDVPLRFRGEAAGRRAGGVVQVVRDTVKVKGPADRIPEIIDLDVTPLEIGQALHANDVRLDAVKVLLPADAALVTVVAPRKEEVVAAAPEAAVPGAEGVPAEGAPAEAAPAEAAAEGAAAAAAGAPAAKGEATKEKGKEKESKPAKSEGKPKKA